MKQKSGFLAFLLSAVILWALSRLPIPFIDIHFGGTTWVTILIVAIVLGLINLILVNLVRSFFKKGSAAFIFVITLVIDAAALMLTGVLVRNFDAGGFVSAVLAAAIIAAACTAAGLVKD